MTDAPATPPQTRSLVAGCLRWAAVIFLIFCIATGVIIWKFSGPIKDGYAWLKALPNRLVTQQLSDTFRQSITSIRSTQGDILEVAVMETDETVTRFDVKTLFQDTIYLGTTTSEIRLPVVYRYHIRLSDDWQLQVEGDQCVIRAPMLRPTLPPAIRTEGMQKKSEAGWLRFNAAENLIELEKNLTPTLEKRAGNAAHLNLVRESARQSIAKFAKEWLLKDAEKIPGGIKSIRIVFPDERPPAPTSPPPPPTLMLELP